MLKLHLQLKIVVALSEKVSKSNKRRFMKPMQIVFILLLISLCAALCNNITQPVVPLLYVTSVISSQITFASV
jgi:hypothetical protein